MLRHILIIILCCPIFSCRQHDDRLSIAFTGDVLLDRGVRQQIEKHGLAFLFEDVEDAFHSSDAVVVNLECPVTDTVSPVNKKYIFRADSKWMPALRSAGITHAALANNHSIDQGRRGLNSTASHLQKAGITSLGYGLNHQSACRPVFISKHGIQVAVFNSVWLPLENWSYLEDNSCICQAGVDELTEQIRTLKKENPACYIVAVLHWGMEYQPKPAIGQRRDAYRLIDAGADVIVGHHPHVVQEKELYKSKPIFYSLGNFVFDSSSPDARKSWLLQLFFDKEGISFNIRKIKINECKPGYAR